MRELPRGTVTFLFTDIEGSTRLLQRLGDGYAEALAEHRRMLRDAFVAHDGVEVDTQGDAFLAVFARASDAVAAAAAGQAALEGGPVRVRMGLHTGEPLLTDEGYIGLDVHRAARIAAAGHGGQVLLSRATCDLVDADVRDLGDHQLKDLLAPERIFQLGDGAFPRLNALYETNLPVQPSPLVGRERELGEITAFVRDGLPLLTLTGAGGSGKTRLALHAAAEVAGDFPDGVWFVPLAGTSDPKLVEPTISQVVGARDSLDRFLRGKKLLLLLDNLEQLLPSVADHVAALPARVVATSRERLGLAAEQEYEVAPLPPDDAASLFVERARQVVPGFEADKHVKTIVRRVDGLPLAVELAASRVKVLSPAQIDARLARNLELLATARRDVPARQRTLRATIEWSYDLLPDEERRVLRALAVFRGSFTPSAAEDVAATDIDTIAALVDRSLLRRGDNDRLFLLETIREYARSQLIEQGEGELVRERHAVFYERWMPDEFAGGEAVAAVAHELDNVRGAVEWVLERGDGERALRTAARAAGLWEHRGLDPEALGWLERALARSPNPSLGRLDALRRMQHYAASGGKLEAAATYGEEALAIAEVLPADDNRLVNVLNRLGVAYAGLGRFDRARERFEDALRLAPHDAAVLNNYGTLEMRVGRYERAEELIGAARFERELSGVRMLALHSLGDLALRRRDYEGACARYADSLAVSEALGLPEPAVYCAGGLAAAAAASGAAEAAARLWGAFERLEDEWGPVSTYERPYYAETVGDVSASPAYIEARSLPAEEARRLVEEYAAAPQLPRA